MENLNERETEEIIEDRLRSKGWKDNPQVKVHRNKTHYFQSKDGEKKWVRPDYILCDFNDNPLLVLEIKKKDSQILGKCLEKAKVSTTMPLFWPTFQWFTYSWGIKATSNQLFLFSLSSWENSPIC